MAREATAPGEDLRSEGDVETIHRDGRHSGDQESRSDLEGTGEIPFAPSRERPKVPFGGRTIRDLNEEADKIMAQAGFRAPLQQVEKAIEVRRGAAEAAEAVAAALSASAAAVDGEPMQTEIANALDAISARVDILTQTAASVVLVATELASIRDQLNGKTVTDNVSTTLFGTQVFQPAGEVIFCKRQELDQRMRQLAADLASLQDASAWADTAAMLPDPTAAIASGSWGLVPAQKIHDDILADERLARMDQEINGDDRPVRLRPTPEPREPRRSGWSIAKYWLK
jgi:hypothetical protein